MHPLSASIRIDLGDADRVGNCIGSPFLALRSPRHSSSRLLHAKHILWDVVLKQQRAVA